jgi:hypothetical protein
MPVADCSMASMLKNRVTQVMRDPVGVVSHQERSVRIEFNYVFELSRNSARDALAYSDNSFRLVRPITQKSGQEYKHTSSLIAFLF